MLRGSSVYTDNHYSYIGLGNNFDHKVVDHAVRYVDGQVHTNHVENFWSLLKRGLHGTYIRSSRSIFSATSMRGSSRSTYAT